MTSALEAELQAIRSTLKVARNLKSEFSSFIIFKDSRSTRPFIEVSKCHVQYFNRQARATEVGKETSFSFCWVLRHRGIPGNVLADHLAKRAATLATVEDTIVPLQFLKEKIRKFSQKLAS